MLPSQDEKYCILTVLFEKHVLQTENDAMLLVQNLAVMQKSIKQLAWWVLTKKNVMSTVGLLT